MNQQLNNLKNQMNKIMQENKPNQVFNSKYDKKIREVELMLTEANVKSVYSVRISDLIEGEDTNFAGGQFKRSEYALSWKPATDENFRLVLTNLPHKNSKVLLKTPDQFKAEVVEHLDNFCKKFSESIK